MDEIEESEVFIELANESIKQQLDDLAFQDYLETIEH
jgi:hypothetical protein